MKPMFKGAWLTDAQAGIVEQVVFWWDVNKWCFVVLKNHPSTTERLKIRGTGSVGKSECRKPDDLVNARIMERGIRKTILFCTSYWNTLRVGFKILFFFVCIGGGEEWVCPGRQGWPEDGHLGQLTMGAWMWWMSVVLWQDHWGCISCNWDSFIFTTNKSSSIVLQNYLEEMQTSWKWGMCWNASAAQHCSKPQGSRAYAAVCGNIHL